MNKLRTQSGLTLIELLISMGLGITISAGVASIYMESVRNYTQNEEIARLQENGRYALKLLRREVSMAGFFAGHSSIPTTDEITTDCEAGVDWVTDTSSPIELLNNFDSDIETVQGTTLTCVGSALQADTDLISIKRFADSYTLRDGSWNDGVAATDSSQWYIRTNNNGNPSWIKGVDISAADATAGSAVDYWEYYSGVFFIRDHSEDEGDEIPSLCAARLQASAMQVNCLVEGIEDMQLEFGIDNDEDGVPDQFVSDPSSAEIETSVAIRAYLLVRAVNKDYAYTNTKTYRLGSKEVAAFNDNYYRRVFSTTVVLQNRNLL